MRKRTIFGFGLLAVSATVAAVTGRQMAKQARVELESRGWKADDFRIVPGIGNGRPALIADLPVNGGLPVRAAYRPSEGWRAVGFVNPDRSTSDLPDRVAGHIYSRAALSKELESARPTTD